MIIMTSLDAQTRFGELVDTSQREPVLITRRGRPVSIMISPAGGTQRMMTQFLQAAASLEPLRGESAVAEFERVVAKLGQAAKKEGLAEASLATLLDESGK